MKLTTVSDSYEAELLAGQLEANGIDSRTLKGSNAPGAWLTGSQNPFGPVEIYVTSSQLRDAQSFVDDVGDAPAPRRSGSSRSVIIAIAAFLVIASIAAILVDGAVDVLR